MSSFPAAFLQSRPVTVFLELEGPLPPAPADPPAKADLAGCCFAVFLNVATALLTVWGFVLQKKASSHTARWVIGDMAISGRWLVGFLIGIVLPIPAQVVAYGLAPMALLTPLSGVSVALNMVVAPKLLGEELQTWPDVPASLAILGGTFLTTIAGPRRDKHVSFDELFALLGRHAFVFSTIGLAIVVSLCIGYMHYRRQQIEDVAKARAGNPNMGHVILPGIVAASFGCLTNICLKAAGELMKGNASFFQSFSWLVGSAVFAIVQLNFVNRGLRLYLQTVFFPVYSALLVMTNTMHGAIFYDELEDLTKEAFRFCIFFSGMGCIVAGIGMFRLRKQNPENAQPAESADTPYQRHLASELVTTHTSNTRSERRPSADFPMLGGSTGASRAGSLGSLGSPIVASSTGGEGSNGGDSAGNSRSSGLVALAGIIDRHGAEVPPGRQSHALNSRWRTVVD